MKTTARIILISSLIVFAYVCFASARVTVRYDSVLQILPLDYHGINFDARWDIEATSAGSMAALRRAGIKLIRFPGGVVANSYDWKNHGTDWDQVLFWNYAHAIGAKAVYTTNAFGNNGSDSTTQHAADWVTFCKDSSIQVAYWEIGNEPDFESAEGRVAFPDRFNSQATAMRLADPTAKIMGPGGTFLVNFAAQCSSKTDYLSWHWYAGGVDWVSTGGVAQNWAGVMSTLWMRIKRPVFVSEWSVLSPTLGGVQGDWNLCLGPAIATIDCIGMFAKTGVIGHTMFCTHGVQNGWGILYSSVDYNPLDYPNPNYFALALWSNMGNKVLYATTTAIQRSQLAVYAHVKQDSVLQVLLINKQAVARTDSISFTGYDPTGRIVKQYQLRGANDTITDIDIKYNGVRNPTPATSDLPGPADAGICHGNPYVCALPPYSATMLEFGAAPGAIRMNYRIDMKDGIRISTGSYPRSIITIQLTKDISSRNPEICIRDMAGRLVDKLSTGNQGGKLEYHWNSGNHASGTYLISITFQGSTLCSKVALP